ncbi:MAG: ABC transporter substrate-binding protein [Deltaproteobacteria bacterium]|nr:ABC transporter substrate-binding protein [Deltaproteobacteria bacterium]
MHRLRVWLAALSLVCSACAATPYYADLPMTPTRGIAESEDALRRGDYATAVSGFTDYLATGQSTFRARAFYQLAQAQYGMESYEAALATLADMQAEFPTSGPQADVLRGDIYYAMGRRTDAIVAWQDAWKVGTDSDRAFIRNRIQEAAGDLTPAQRSVLADQLTDAQVREILGLGAPNELGASGGEPLPGQLTGKAAEAESEADAAAGYAALEADTPPPADLAAGDALATGVRVAALLPLTGPDKAQGQRALSGLRLAFDGTERMLVVRDTADQADLAAQLADALASEPNVIAIIGPLSPSTAAAVAPLAERLQLPTLLLAGGSNLAGAFVLQPGASARTTSPDFATRFRTANGYDPGSTETAAYDAGLAVREAIAGGAHSRGALLAALRKSDGSAER